MCGDFCSWATPASFFLAYVKQNQIQNRNAEYQSACHFSCSTQAGLFVRWNPEVNRNRAGSRLLFLKDFLESGIAAQWVPERIEPKNGRRKRRSAATVNPRDIWGL